VSVTAGRSWRSSLMRAPDNVSFMPWLRDRGSLTARIQARGPFCRSGAAPGPRQSQRPMKHWRSGCHARRGPGCGKWALSCDGQIVVFAHTVLPHRPRGPLSLWLARLGNRSLGALLFAHPGFERGAMKFKRPRSPTGLVHTGADGPATCRGVCERALGTPLAVRFRRAIRPGDRGLFSTRATTLTIRQRKLDETRVGAIMRAARRRLGGACNKHREPGRNPQALLPSGVDSISAVLAQSFCADWC
jgi:hypothetical protein